MFAPYKAVLRRPGAVGFTAAGALGRLHMAMSGIGTVMLIKATRDSYALAGVVSAIYTLSAAIVSPQVSRMIDSFGQRKVVRIALAVHIPLLGAMIALAVYTRLDVPILILAVFAGATQPNIGPLVRARWSAILSGTPGLRTAFAWESMVDEAVFIIGPPVVTMLAVQVFPAAGLLTGGLLLTVGALLLVKQKSTEPTPTGWIKVGGRQQKPAIMLPGVAAIAIVMFFIGGIFGILEVTTVAAAEQAGRENWAGPLVACYSVGSLLGGLFFGSRELKASLLRQFVIAVAVMALVTSPLWLITDLSLLGIGLFVSGVGCAPALISGTALVQRIVPASRLTESMSWTSSGIAVGISGMMPLAGLIVDENPARWAYLLMGGCAVAALAVAFLVLQSLRRAQAAAILADAQAMDEPLLDDDVPGGEPAT